jgi:para-aminobenzoate synthetase / 4-amino-4-deoxychorismate lyase
VRLVREPLDTGGDPLGVARWLRGEDRPVVLSGHWSGGGTLLTSHPADVAAANDDPFELLDRPPVLSASGPVAGAETVGGGWFGWLGYGLARSLERLPPPPPRPDPLPLFDLAFHDHVVRCDAAGRWWFEALWSEGRADWLRRRFAIWRARLAADPPPPEPHSAGPLVPAGGGTTAHLRAVAETVERIAAGDLSQANICMRLEGQLCGDPLDLWIDAVAAAAPAYAAYVGGETHAVLSLSPELFLRRRGRNVHTAPIKGTAPRASDPVALSRSEKDRAENVMIVDLMRNDLGRVCEYGSIVVDRLCEVEPAAGVWHLVSSISGRTREGVTDGELLRAAFPPGSVTGAPKIRAMQLINELESTAREAYCGIVGLSSPLSGLEFNVAIRTLETRSGWLWLGAGGGIVSDSEPVAEVDEAMTKARGVAASAGIEVRNRCAPAGPIIGPTRHSRPEPALDVIETIRVCDGEPVWLEAHLARLDASCEMLGITPGGDLARRIAATASRFNACGLRIEVSGRGTTISTRRLPEWGAVSLAPIVLPGGLGAHKWADRRLILELSVDGRVPLFLDLDGTVLEAGHAAVALAVRGTLLVPPLDGRILPSVSRAQLLTDGARVGYEVQIETFTLRDVRAADALILTSALRGAHPGALGSIRSGDRAAVICRDLAPAAIGM